MTAAEGGAGWGAGGWLAQPCDCSKEKQFSSQDLYVLVSHQFWRERECSQQLAR